MTVEPRADRIATIRANLDAFGLGGRITVIEGAAPEALPSDTPASTFDDGSREPIGEISSD